MTTETQKTEMYNKHKRLAAHLAWKFARAYRLDPNDALDHAISALGHCIAKWDVADPSDTPTCHGLYCRIRYKLIDYLAQRRRQQCEGCFPQTDDDGRFEPQARQSFLGVLMSSLGDDARLVVTIIVDAPSEIANDVSTRCVARARKAVRNYLQQMGWDKPRINRAWREVEACLA